MVTLTTLHWLLIYTAGIYIDTESSSWSLQCTFISLHHQKQDLQDDLRVVRTMVASVATLKPFPSVVSSVFGASDGGESRKELFTFDRGSVIGTSDREGLPPKRFEKNPPALA